MGGDGEGQADVHAGRVVLDGGVNEFFELREGHDFVEFLRDFAAGHAEDGAGKEGVFADGELGMEAGADFEERADAPVNLRPPCRRSGNPRKDFQQRCFPRPVPPDQPQHFAFLHVQRDVL